MTGSSPEEPNTTSLKSLLERIDNDFGYGGPPSMDLDVDPGELLRGVREQIGGSDEPQPTAHSVQPEQEPEPREPEVQSRKIEAGEEDEPPRSIRMSSGFDVSLLTSRRNSTSASQANPTAFEENSGGSEAIAQNRGMSGGRLALVLPKRTSSRVWFGVLMSGAVVAGSAYLALLRGTEMPSWPWDGAFVQGGSVPLRGPKIATRSVETVDVVEASDVHTGSSPAAGTTGGEVGVVGVDEMTKADTAITPGSVVDREVRDKGFVQDAGAGSGARQVAAVDKAGVGTGQAVARDTAVNATALQVQEPDVVLVQPGDQLAIPVKLDPVHAPRDVAALMLRGFPRGFDVKNATATGAGTFVMLPGSVGDARVVVPPGAVGDILVVVDMFNSGGQRVAQTHFRLRSEPVMTIRTEADEIVQGLMDKGMKLMQSGDIAGARLLFKRATESGHAPGALALGETYDPARLALAGVVGMRGDRAQALYWYGRASSDGEARARHRLETLQALRP